VAVSELLELVRQTLAGEYAVEREIGRGGMATVFLAEELQPRRRVAIKVLNPEVASKLVRERFLREIEVASNLTHPHILPVFTAGSADSLVYYVMPFIEGDSVRERLTQQGALEVREATEIALEVASALNYAHGKGVVHRDIKPENILLVAGHAVVVDFGVARAIGAARASALTESGIALGTPKYMSSEQWSADDEIDGRADIYSLGCVLLEMLEGSLPHGDPAAAFRTQAGMPFVTPPPSRVPRELQPVLKRALAADRADRFDTAAGFARALQQAVGVSKPSDRRTWIWAAAVLGVALFAAVVAVRFWPGHGIESAIPRVVVARFENRTGDSSLAPLASIATDWITRGLAQTGLVEVVDTRSSLASSAASESQAGLEASERAAEVARQTRAAVVVWGYYYVQGESIRFEAQITDVSSGILLEALDPVAGSRDNPLDAIEVLRQRVMGAMATLFDMRLGNWADRSTQPPSFEAYREYIDGLTLVMQLRQREGIPLLYHAASGDSNFVAPLVFAAFAHATVSQWPQADSLAHVLERRSELLTPFNRLLLDWIHSLVDGDIPAQLEHARDMADLAPGAEAMTLVATSALAANRPREALRALESLPPDQGLVRGFFLYWEHLTTALHLLGEHRRELLEARRGRVRHPSHPSLIESEMRALAALGRTAELDSLADVLLTMPVNSQWSTGDILCRSALELRAHGQEATARSLLQRSVAWFQSAPPSEAAVTATLFGLAQAYYSAGELDSARVLAERLSRTYPDSVSYAGLLGVVLATGGSTESAQRIDRRLQQFRQPYLYGSPELWRARMAAIQGEQDAALSLVREALQQGRAFDLNLHAFSEFAAMREYPPFRELLRPQG
jgi:tRNA A-37 threonylcarbamoyl transferase component Bud32/TolB-like protein/tetratricopeptide (TPR) repeat protein